jgi:hypothetical protein
MQDIIAYTSQLTPSNISAYQEHGPLKWPSNARVALLVHISHLKPQLQMTLERLQELAVSYVLQVFTAQMMVWDQRMLNLLTVHPDTIARKER